MSQRIGTSTGHLPQQMYLFNPRLFPLVASRNFCHHILAGCLHLVPNDRILVSTGSMLLRRLITRALSRCQSGLFHQTEEAGGDLYRTLLRRGHVHAQLAPRRGHRILMSLSVCRYNGYRYRRRPSPHTLQPVSWLSLSAANS